MSFWQFWVIFGPFWAILGQFWAILGHFRSFSGHFLVLFFWPKIYLCYFYYFLHLCLKRIHLTAWYSLSINLNWTICHQLLIPFYLLLPLLTKHKASVLSNKFSLAFIVIVIVIVQGTGQVTQNQTEYVIYWYVFGS